MALSRRLRGIRARIPAGYLLARISAGDGGVQPVKVSDLVTAGILGSASESSKDDFLQSLALAMPAEFNVAGSPVTGPGGTLTVTKATETANKVWAGPTSGAAAQPTFRALVAADMPGSGAGSGTVTSVALTAPIEFSVGGSPITTSGTLALSWATEAANKVLSGPTTGSPATPGFRSLVAADIPDLSGTYLPLHGTADAALKWSTARTLSFTGDATGSGSVDGSASVATALTLAASGVSAATYGDATHVPQIAVDAKGRITSASSVSITQPLAANPTAQVAGSAVNGSASTFMRSDAAPKLADTAVTPAAYGDSTHYATFTVDQQGRLTAAASVSLPAGAAGANPTATAGPAAVNGVATTFMRSDGAPAVQKASSSQFGIVEVDGTTISATAGVISAAPAIATAEAYTDAAVPTAANPTASVGLTAVNGTSAHFLRADGAPALDQSISPTWSGSHTFSNPVKFADGSASSASVLFDTNRGFYNDTTNSGVGIVIGGAQIGYFGSSSIVSASAGLVTSAPGSAANQVLSDALAQVVTGQFSSNITGSRLSMNKARGSRASPAVVAQNDQLFNFRGSGYDGAAYQIGFQIQGVVIEPTPSATAMGSSLRFQMSALGATGSTTEVARLEADTGLSMFGANPVVDQNRVFRLRALTTSAAAALSPLPSTGLVQLTDEGGGICVGYTDGTSVRRTSDLQVATTSTPTSRGLLGRMTSRVAYVNQDIVQRTYQKLSTAGLLTKLLGLWVHAGAPTSQADALRNWITLGTRDLVVVGSPTWSQTGGFTGDGTTALLNTVASIATFGASQNSFTVGCYVLAASASAAAVIGQNSSAASRGIYMQSFTSGALTTRCMDATNDSFTPTRYTGLFTMSRTLSTGYNDSLDDLAATAVTRTSAGFTGRAVAFLGTNDTTANEFSTAQIAFSFIGNGLTATDVANLRAIMVDYYLVETGVLSSTYTVARLPGATAAFEGQRIMVSDGSVVASGNFGTVVAGGGTNHVPTYYESGTPAWRIG